ncbi:MAG: lytic transglycosylase domain-containing protein [Chloroflexi bacterium]|nr:lytic transglycosylase domain-containing protein [Chloroflexota bacterium]
MARKKPDPPPEQAAAKPAKPAPKRQKKRESLRVRARRWYRRTAWVALVVVLGALALAIFRDSIPFLGGTRGGQNISNENARLAPFYADGVLRWEDRIREWAREFDVNPNLIALVMQIESCGDQTAISRAGAMGLMQVMPFHFRNGENMLDPDTNVRRGMIVFYECLTQFADWDVGMALACYNGGPSVTQRAFNTWAQETQSYYRWATGIWQDVQLGNESSQTISDWLGAGGSRLCTSAAQQSLPSAVAEGS